MRRGLSMTALSMGVFGIISTEIGLVGVLPLVASRTHVSVAEAGLLVSVFAVVVAASGPFGVLLTERFDRKSVLLVAMGVFALSNAVYAVSESFPVLVVFRILPALMHPVYFAFALTAAGSMAAPGKAAGAAARVFAGVTLGFAFGVPAMSFLADRFTLPVAFAAAGVVNVLALVGIALWVPALPAAGRTAARVSVGTLRRPRVWLQLATVTAIFVVMFSTYSYFADLLGTVAGMPGPMVSVLLLVFGVVMVGGNFLFARLIARGLRATLLGFLLAYAVLYVVLALVAPWAWAIGLLVIPWSLVHSGGLLLGQSLIAGETSDAPEFGNSLFVSSSNIGVALGSALGALSISVSGVRSVLVLGAVAALLSLVLVLAVRSPTRRAEVDLRA